ncbi:hypothetical protein DBV05_g10485 [Lasiodiplodia theobromae]|uniref:Uncharacterized protein n=1 Tax=Lasiodiplodia theobromae TaxID=45133 RepID=A0A5N5CZT7_9PEZI|nr:hypothetical protein DBV05_g10485 [Lasiodiplodia theobromae]
MPFLLGSIRPILHASVVAQIRNWHISVRLDADPYFNAAEVTAAFSNADSLEVECWQAQFEACDYSVLRLFQDVRGVGRAKVSGSVGYGFAHWLELVMESPKEMEEEMETGFSTPGRGQTSIDPYWLDQVVHVVYFVLNAKVDDSPEDSAYLTMRF